MEQMHYGYDICTAETDRSDWHPRVAAFFDYWLRISPAGRLPGRQHVDPVDIPLLLSSMWLFEVHRNPLRLRVRVFGTRLVEILRIDPTGQWFDETPGFSAALNHTPLILAKFIKVAEEGTAVHSVNRTILFGQERQHLLENVTVPLAQDGKTVDMLAGFSWFTSLEQRRI